MHFFTNNPSKTIIVTLSTGMQRLCLKTERLVQLANAHLDSVKDIDAALTDHVGIRLMLLQSDLSVWQVHQPDVRVYIMNETPTHLVMILESEVRAAEDRITAFAAEVLNTKPPTKH